MSFLRAKIKNIKLCRLSPQCLTEVATLIRLTFSALKRVAMTTRSISLVIGLNGCLQTQKGLRKIGGLTGLVDVTKFRMLLRCSKYSD